MNNTNIQTNIHLINDELITIIENSSSVLHEKIIYKFENSKGNFLSFHDHNNTYSIPLGNILFIESKKIKGDEKSYGNKD